MATRDVREKLSNNYLWILQTATNAVTPDYFSPYCGNTLISIWPSVLERLLTELWTPLSSITESEFNEQLPLTSFTIKVQFSGFAGGMVKLAPFTIISSAIVIFTIIFLVPFACQQSYAKTFRRRMTFFKTHAISAVYTYGVDALMAWI